MEDMGKKKDHEMKSMPKEAKMMPTMDMDKEMGNMKGMCKMVSEKN